MGFISTTDELANALSFYPFELKNINNDALEAALLLVNTSYLLEMLASLGDNSSLVAEVKTYGNKLEFLSYQITEAAIDARAEYDMKNGTAN